MRVMLVGVGYQNLSDLSVGPYLVPKLRELDWPEDVEIDDWSFGPIAVVQRLEDRPGYYDRIVFISAVERGREPGSVQVYQWNHQLPDADEIQRRIGEAIMGVISLDNLLIIAQYLRALPSDVVVVEVEPEDTDWGETFTPRVHAALDEVIRRVREAALDPVRAAV
jgi:hydrogenase maturation protease